MELKEINKEKIAKLEKEQEEAIKSGDYQKATDIELLMDRLAGY